MAEAVADISPELVERVKDIYSNIDTRAEGCYMCGDCCVNTFRISYAEAAYLMNHLQENLSPEELQRLRKESNNPLKMVGDNKCPLNERRTDLCIAYEARPLICRIYYLKKDGWHIADLSEGVVKVGLLIDRISKSDNVPSDFRGKETTISDWLQLLIKQFS